VKERRNGLVLVGKGLIDGSSVEVDFRDDALYATYTRVIEKNVTP
jgi:hypothetical protein